MTGMVPENLVELSTQTKSFRDLVMAYTLECADTESVLSTFTQNIRSVEGPLFNKTDMVYCEYAASLAFAMGNTDLFKEILLRVDPTKLSSFLYMLYKAIIVDNNLSSDTYIQLVKQAKDENRVLWESEKVSLNI